MNVLSQPARQSALLLRTGQRSPRLRLLALLVCLCGACGLGLAVFDQVERGSSRHAIALAFFGVFVAGVVARNIGVSSVSAQLEIDADGAAFLSPTPPSPVRIGLPLPPEHRQGASAFQPIAWFCWLGIVWITGRCDSGTVRFVLARDGLPDDDWIRLRRWLRWLDRGGHVPGLSSLETPPSPPLFSNVDRLKGRP